MNRAAEIISIGNEVLSGYTVNTNAAFIARQLLETGLEVHWITVIQDDRREILNALHQASQRASAVLVTGGLGPTPDDITRQAICRYFNTDMIFEETVLKQVQRYLNQRGIELNESNRKQALIPRPDHIISNPVGTAPGLIFERSGVYYFFMPGVPGEMRYMIREQIRPFIQQHMDLPAVVNRILRTTGIPEAGLYEKLKDLLREFPQFSVAFLPRYIGVDLRFRLNDTAANSRRAFDSFYNRVHATVKKYVFSDQEMELEEVVGQILQQRGLTLAVAESFTGGLIGDWITNVAGSSRYFMTGLTTYSNQSKMDYLSVKPQTIEQYGAVSKPTALEMVRGLQTNTGCDCAIAATGIAGPGGGSAKKPVGLSYIAARVHSEEMAKEFRFGSERIINKKRGAMAALEMLRRLLLGST